MKMYHSCVIARISLILFGLVISISSYSSTSCSYSISYGLIQGTYTDVLGKVDPGLAELAEQMIKDHPEYCNVNIRIEFKTPLSDRQLVSKKLKGNKHVFKISYKAPEYSVTILDSEGETLHELTFANEWASVMYPQDLSFSSKEALYQHWNQNRELVYTQLEEQYNEYHDLKRFLKDEMLKEPTLLSSNTPIVPRTITINSNGTLPQNLMAILNRITEEVEIPDLLQMTALLKKREDTDDNTSGGSRGLSYKR